MKHNIESAELSVEVNSNRYGAYPLHSKSKQSIKNTFGGWSCFRDWSGTRIFPMLEPWKMGRWFIKGFLFFRSVMDLSEILQGHDWLIQDSKFSQFDYDLGCRNIENLTHSNSA